MECIMYRMAQKCADFMNVKNVQADLQQEIEKCFL